MTGSSAVRVQPLGAPGLHIVSRGARLDPFCRPLRFEFADLPAETRRHRRRSGI